MRKLIVATALLSLITTASAAASQKPFTARTSAAPLTYLYPRHETTAYGYIRRTYKPRTVVLTAELTAVDVTWKYWGGHLALGRGKVYGLSYNDSIGYPTTLVVTDPKTETIPCESVNRTDRVRFYMHMTARISDDGPGNFGGENFAARPIVQC